MPEIVILNMSLQRKRHSTLHKFGVINVLIKVVCDINFMQYNSSSSDFTKEKFWEFDM